MVATTTMAVAASAAMFAKYYVSPAKRTRLSVSQVQQQQQQQ